MYKISTVMMCCLVAFFAFLFISIVSSFALEVVTACAKNNNGQLRLEECDVVDSSGCLNSEYCVELGGSSNGGSLPDGMIAFFAGDCPEGWVEYEAAKGFAIVGLPVDGELPNPEIADSGTFGSPLANLEDRTAHTHSIENPAGTTSDNGSHSHTATIAATTSFAPGNGMGTAAAAASHIHSATISNSGIHSHSVNVPDSMSGTPLTPNSVANEDVLPYIQLRACITQSME